MDKDKVRGHMCEGLREFQDNSTYECIPDYSEEGFVRGCDDTNKIPIKNCPFCGVLLPKPKVYKYQCDLCGLTWKSYNDYDDNCKAEDCYGFGDLVSDERWRNIF